MKVGDKVKITLTRDIYNNKVGTVERITPFSGTTAVKVVFANGDYCIYDIKNLEKVKQ